MRNLLKGAKFSLVASLLLSSSLFAADSIDSAIKSGTVSGDVSLFGMYHDGKGGEKDDDFGAISTGLAYETASYMGLSAKAGFRGAHVFGDSDDFAKEAIMNEAYIKYANDAFSLSVGRQEIDLEWLGDYNESIVGQITAIPNTAITLGYVNEQATVAEDEISDFDEVTEDGAYVVDVKYTGLQSVEFNPYFYSAPDVANFYGLKATYSSDMFGAVAHYAASDEDQGKDGSIGHVQLSTGFEGLSFALGYIKTDKDVGIASMGAYGDNISPFDEGANTYSADAKTVYGSIGYSIAGVDLGLLYGETDFANNGEEKELNLTADYSINDSLGLSLVYVDYDLEGSSNEDFNAGKATLSYSF